MYNLFIKIFIGGIHLASFFNKKAALLVKGHDNLLTTISEQMNEIRSRKKAARTYLIHCASLGEFEQGRPLIEAIRKREDDSIIILTFFSPSGYCTKKDYPQVDATFYLPFDTKRNAKNFAKIIKPDISIFVKYEYWRNIFKELRDSGSKLYIVSAIFQSDMIFFKWYGNFFRRVLKYVSHFFVQDEESKKLLQSIGINSVTVTGDTRFDRVIDITKSEPSERINFLEKFVDKKRAVFVAGSVWESDMKNLNPFILNHKDDIQFIIIPHEIHEKQIAKWTSELRPSLRVANFSKLESSSCNDIPLDVIFINCVGMLSQIYKFASLTFIGGGYDRLGIHNTLEPAVWGKAIIFGPIYSQYIEAVNLIKCKGAFCVKTTEEIENFWQDFLQNGDQYAEAAYKYVISNLGSTDKILSKIL